MDRKPATAPHRRTPQPPSTNQGVPVGSTNRPMFDDAWAASQQIFDPLNPLGHVAEVIGGNVAHNINHPLAPWKNSCAIRMSYILNKTGNAIPFRHGKTVSGGDSEWYFYRVKDLVEYLQETWGGGTLVRHPTINSHALLGHRGVLLFIVSGWSDAAGHATLFDGATCYDHAYFYDPGAEYTTKQAIFWELP